MDGTCRGVMAQASQSDTAASSWPQDRTLLNGFAFVMIPCRMAAGGITCQSSFCRKSHDFGGLSTILARHVWVNCAGTPAASLKSQICGPSCKFSGLRKICAQNVWQLRTALTPLFIKNGQITCLTLATVPAIEPELVPTELFGSRTHDCEGCWMDTCDVTTLLARIYSNLDTDAQACSRCNLLDKGILCLEMRMLRSLTTLL
eukprot:350136-Chlamydomonas_euryale.AAC.17